MKKISSIILSFIIIAIGLMLSGCTDPYASIRLLPSVDFISLEVGSKSTFEVSFENYFENMNFSVSIFSENNCVEITDIDYSQKGKVLVEIQALKVGEESLFISSFEGSKTCLVNAKVFQPVSSFSLRTIENKQNEPYTIKPYVIKEEGFQLNFAETNYFEFSPKNSSDTISYFFNDNGNLRKVLSASTIIEDDNLLVVLNSENGQITITDISFELTAMLDNYPNVEEIVFEVDVIEPIQLGEFNIIKQGYTNAYFSSNEFINLKSQNEIVLISNNTDYSYVAIELQILSPNVTVSVEALKSEILQINPEGEEFTATSDYSYIFSLQSRELGEDTLHISISYEEYEGYELEYDFIINTVSVPTSIRVNDKVSFEQPIYLYDTYSDIAHSEAEYNISLAVYSLDSVFDSISFSFVTNNYADLTEPWANYVNVKYKNQVKTQNFIIEYADFVDNFLNSPISLLGEKQFDGELYIKLVLNSEYYLQSEIVYYVPIVIEEGAISFEVNPAYANGLSLDIANGIKTFEGLMIQRATAYIGAFAFEYINNSNLIFTVEQVLLNQKSIRITPLSVGQGVVRIILPNGLSVDLTIKIESAVSSANLSVINSGEISLAETDENGNISYLAIKYMPENIFNPAPLKLNLKLLTNPTNATLYLVNFEVSASSIISFDSNTFILTVKNAGQAHLKITLILLEALNFELINADESIEFNLDFDIYYPVKSFDFMKDSNKTTIATVFKSSDVGYKYTERGYSKIEIDLNVILHNNTTINDLFLYFGDKVTWTTELGVPHELSSSIATGTYIASGTISNFGKYQINGNHLVLTCDDLYAKANSSFWLAFTISEYNLSKTAILNISILNYIPLYSVGFYNYSEEIYLSDSNPTYIFNTFLNPLSDCKEFNVVFEPKGATSESLVSIYINPTFTQVNIRYNGTGTGYGTIYFIPLSSYIDEIHSTYKTSIEVRVSDGTDKNNPLIINTAQEFVTIMQNSASLTKHFKITTTLDFDNVTIPALGEFKGSITGANTSARLINIKINSYYTESSSTYAGLFSKLSQTAEIKNLVFEGYIDISRSTGYNFYAGLIAGESRGLIENVSVIIKRTTIMIENRNEGDSSAFICVGGMVGINNGLIINKINYDNTNHTAVNQTDAFEVKYQGYSPNVFVGGVVGDNRAVITREENGTNTFYNQSIYGAIVNILTTGVNSTGGIAGSNTNADINIYGYNKSIINNLLVSGNIVSTRYQNSEVAFTGGQFVGGITGDNYSYISNCISRVFVEGYNYVGGIAGRDNLVIGFTITDNPLDFCYITNCTVQAIFSGSFKYMIKAYSMSGNIGAMSGNTTSLINEKIYVFGGNHAYYYYEINITNKIYPLSFYYDGFNYLNIKYDATDPYYSLFIQDDKELAISAILSDYEFGAGKLETASSQFDNKVAYMFYYSAVTNAEQGFIDNLNFNRQNPFVFVNSNSLVLTSLNQNILNFDANGNVYLYGTGTATILVKSLLNSNKSETYVYIVVTNAFDSFEIKVDNYSLSENSFIIVYENLPVELYYEFSHSDIEARDNYQQIVWVKTKDNNSAGINFVVNEPTHYIETLTAGNSIILRVSNLLESNSTNTIKFSPKFVLNLNIVGQVYMQSDGEHNEFEHLITKTANEINVISVAKRGTEKIDASISNITAEPLDVLEIGINQITDYENDTLKISSVKIDEEENGITDYFVILDYEGYTYLSFEDLFEYNGTAGKFYLQFNYAKYAHSGLDYTGTYYINFTADNGIVQTIIVYIEKQQVANILIKNYYNVPVVMDFSKSEENYVAAGATSLLSLDVYPFFAEYDYIKIENSNINYQSGNALVFEVVKPNSENRLETVYGVEYTAKGVKVPASVIKDQAVALTSARIYIKYTTTSLAPVDSLAGIIVSAIKLGGNNNEIIESEQTHTVSVVMKDTVSFSIVGKSEINGKYYVAKGLSYELDLNIFGFSEDQVKIEISPEYATINKVNGIYYLNIASDINYVSGQEGYSITITTYAENIIDGFHLESEKSVLNLVVVDYVVLMENINSLNLNAQGIETYQGYTVIENGSSGIIRTAIGNTNKLAVKFVNGLTIEYDHTNALVSSLVKEFESILTYSGEFGIIASKTGIAGDYITTLKFTPSVNVINEYLRITSQTINSKTNYSITPVKINPLEGSLYYFTYTGGFYYLNGLPKFSTNFDKGVFNLSTHFVFDVYSTGTEYNSVPIYNYTDLMNMRDGGWYILMNDLTLPNTFEPINKAIAGFNGNGYNIYLPTVWNVSENENVGLFGEVIAGTVLKNITLKIAVSTRVEINNPTAINFGFIAGFNNGSITNCAVICESLVTATVSISGQSTTVTDNYVAGFVGYNRGYITNSQVEMVLVATANVAGFVGVNEKYISSSYVSNSRIVNRSGDISNHTAGFAIKNGVSITTDAHISTSYVSGAFSETTIYSRGTEKIISSDTQVSGFVYDNFSKISDCYSNIPIYSNSLRTGFVFNNAGLIKNTYSTTTFGQSGQTAYGFVVNNTIATNQGKIENSIYLLGTVNSTVNKTSVSGVSYLSEAEFAFSSFFESFIISSQSHKTEGIWFYPSKNSETEFVKFGENQRFIYGKLELVAPNIKADTKKSLDPANITVDPVTGETTYVYVETGQTEGSLFNPFTISSATDLERIMLFSSNKNINSNYFRIVSLIDYEAENIVASKIYKTIFKGDLEGNNMTIAGFVIDTKENLVNGGLFAKVGSGSTGEGCIKNLNLKPKYINMPNTSNVGTLAGSLESGKLYNVTVNGFGYSLNEGLVIIGHYCVGGVVGVALNNFTINNISSSMSARASFTSRSTTNIVGIYTTKKTTQVSYAGALIGVANNAGTIFYASVNNKIASIAEISGLMFGKIGTNVTAKIINVVLNENQFVRATAYGGIIAGENCGTISDVNISGITATDFFRTSPILPTAVGGAVGLMYNGRLQNIVCSVGLSWSTNSPIITGGIVGEMLGGNIINTTFGGTINIEANAGYIPTTGVTVGGIVGKMTYIPTVIVSSTLTASNSVLKNCLTDKDCEINVSSDSVYKIYVGGLIGKVINTYKTYKFNNENYVKSAYDNILNGCANSADISINSVIFDGTMFSYVGGLVGGVFSDTNENYKGEIIIYDEETEQEIYDLYASSSDSNIYINIKDMKNNGIVTLRYGGILGFGYSVSDATEILGTPSTYFGFGQMLESAAEREDTDPYYSGQYSYDDEGNPTEIPNMQDSEYLLIVISLKNQNNAIIEQN